MSCCGNKPTDHTRNLAADKPFHRPNPSASVLASIHEVVFFEYTGDTALTVSGAVTGKQYRFIRHNDVQAIDYLDAGSMMAVSVLRKLKQKTDRNISA